MELNYFDLIASIIILLLGLKGILNGFFKELFGLVGIVGGIFIASRLGDKVGQQLSDLIFKFENDSAIAFTGFLATLFGFWLLMVLVGYAFKKLSSMSGLGPVDKILGFVFGASKFFLIAAVIAHAAYNIKTIKTNIEPSMKSSVLFPILVKTGGIIMKLDPVDLNDNLKETQDAIQNKIDSTISDSTLDIVNDAKKQLSDSMPDMTKNISNEK